MGVPLCLKIDNLPAKDILSLRLGYQGGALNLYREILPRAGFYAPIGKFL